MRQVRKLEKHAVENLRPYNLVVKTDTCAHNYISNHIVDGTLEGWKTEAG